MRPRKEWYLILTLAAVQFTNIMDFMIVMPLGPQLIRLFDITPHQFGVIVASYTFSAGFFCLLGTLFIDRYDRKEVLVICYLGFLFGTLICAVSENFTMLLIGRIVTGAFGGVMVSTVLSIIGDAFPYNQRSTALGYVMMGFSLASVLGVPVGLYLSNIFDWHTTFLGIFIISLLVLLGIFRFIPSMTGHINSNQPQELFTDKLKDLLGDRNHLIALWVMVFLMMGQFTVIPYISTYMVTNFFLTEEQLPLIYIFGGAASFVLIPLIGKLCDKFGNLKVMTGITLLSVISIYCLTNLSAVNLPVILFITTTFFVFIGGRSIPATTMITSSVELKHRGGFMSLSLAVRQFSIAFAAYFSSLILTSSAKGELENFNIVGYVAIGFSLLCLYLVSKVKRKS